VYVNRRFQPSGFDIVNVKDPEKAYVMYSWRIENPMLHGPHCCLSAVTRPDLSKDPFDVSLDRRLSDLEEPCNVLVGISFNNPFENCDLSNR